MKKIGIVILNYNDAKTTLECLESLKKCTTHDIVQIIVIDNCSTDDSYINLQKEISDDAILKKSDFNGGFAYGNNIGIKTAISENCEYVLLLNNDTVVSPDFLGYLTDALEDPTIGIAGPKIMYFDKKDVIWSKGGRMNWMYAGENGCCNHKDDMESENTEATFLTGCCMMFRSELVKSVGYLSEEYFIYYEDLEFSDRVIRAGYRLMCIPKSVIWHKVGMSNGGDKSPFMLENVARSHRVFIDWKKKQEKRAVIIGRIVFIRNLIRVFYFAVFKSMPQAKAIWRGMFVR